jgi:hypothetical protein
MCFVWIWEQTAIIFLCSVNWLVFVTETEYVYCAVRTEHLTFTNPTFCPHTVFMCFVWIWEQTAIISLYSVNWLVFVTETGSVYCAVRTEHLTFTNPTFCPHSVFMCSVWIWEQTAIISLYSVNWLVFVTETECLVRGTDWTFNIHKSYVLPTHCIYVFCVDLRKTAIFSLYNINWLVFIRDGVFTERYGLGVHILFTIFSDFKGSKQNCLFWPHL